jgi:hypothetical protein
MGSRSTLFRSSSALPVAVKAKYPGKGDNSHDGYVIFDPEQYAERQGLLFLNHVIYTGWTSHCDSRPYTGWLIGYGESMLTQTSVLNVTPNGNKGSIWQAGAGIASDGQSLFFLDANGTFDTTLDKKGFPIKGDYGNGFLKVSATNNKLRVVDYFSMFNTVQGIGRRSRPGFRRRLDPAADERCQGKDPVLGHRSG